VRGGASSASWPHLAACVPVLLAVCRLRRRLSARRRRA
jgi:hypothetical protein